MLLTPLLATFSCTHLQQPVLNERAEGREARARPHHDDGRGGAVGQPEVGVLGDEDQHLLADGGAGGDVGGAHADTVTTQRFVLDLCDGGLGGARQGECAAG